MRLKIAVFGLGHLGKIHVKLLLQLQQYELVGFYDPDDKAAMAAVRKFGIKRFEDIDDLIDQVDAVDIVSPTTTHYEVAIKALSKGKHIFVEKPLTATLAEAKAIQDLVKSTSVKAQVGHVERFNPAVLSAKELITYPRFIESHRLAQFNPRGMDVSVVMDLMIHDLDIILHFVKSDVKEVHANGVNVVGELMDMANARIIFENGCVANVTASRLSMKNMRKMRIFQPDAYLSIDMLNRSTELVALSEKPSEEGISMSLDTGKGIKKYVSLHRPLVEPNNAIKEELRQFADCILSDKKVPISVRDGYKAMRLAHLISDEIQKNSQAFELNRKNGKKNTQANAMARAMEPLSSFLYK